MRLERLLALYPPAWRARYGDEFMAVAGDRRVDLRSFVDVVAGALDAWLSADVRHATMAHATRPGGSPMVLSSLVICRDRRQARLSPRDGVIGAAAMVGITVVFAAAQIAAKALGWRMTAEVLQVVSFGGAVALSMPFWLTKGLPWKAQAVFVGAMLAVLTAIGLTAAIANR